MEENKTLDMSEVSDISAISGTESITSPSPEEVNAANAAASTGKVSDDGQGAAFFTAADVRAMSREQVRRNLDKILKSMESSEF